MNFACVYMLRGFSSREHSYVGFTEDVRARLQRHNTGASPHTSKSQPWRIKTAIAFPDRNRAVDLERHLKTASGRACAMKRL